MNASSDRLSIQMVRCYHQVLLSLLYVWVSFSSLPVPVLLNFNFLVKERKCPTTNLQTILHQFQDYKLLFIPKATKGLVNSYPITYNKPPVKPVSQKIGAHFIKTSLSEPILRPTHQCLNKIWTMQELGSATENPQSIPKHVFDRHSGCTSEW